jgi:hypothetical protein
MKCCNNKRVYIYAQAAGIQLVDRCASGIKITSYVLSRASSLLPRPAASTTTTATNTSTRNHGRLRLVSLVRASDRRRNAPRGYHHEWLRGQIEEEEAGQHPVLLQTKRALAVTAAAQEA